MAVADRLAVDTLLDQLEEVGATQAPRPLQNKLLWGNYEVAYTSTRRAIQQGEPAGGRFRGTLGRLLFRTVGVFQSVLQPDVATNKVEFKLFGFIPGWVGLRGKVVPVGDTGDTVQVLFERPVLSLAGWHLRIGPPSRVQLTTQYLDERVRLGKGSRGSLFVFTRGGAADAAAMDQVGLQRTSKVFVAVLAAVAASMLAAGFAAWSSGQLIGKPVALMLWGIGLSLGLVLRSGGIIDDAMSTPPSGSSSSAAGAQPPRPSGAPADGAGQMVPKLTPA